MKLQKPGMGTGSFETIRGENPYKQIHGELLFELNERRVPCMGYFGPADVCFNDWFKEFFTMSRLFSSGESKVYVYDSGEQGHPLFRFELIKSDIVALSITDRNGTEALEGWSRVCFSFHEFKTVLDRCYRHFLVRLAERSPEQVGLWAIHTGEGSSDN